MARTKGAKGKKTKATKAPEPVNQPEIKPEINEKPVKPVETEKPKDNSGLEDSPFFSIDEAARFLGVEERCARLWYEHGKLSGKVDHGFKRVSRASILRVKDSNLMMK